MRSASIVISCDADEIAMIKPIVTIIAKSSTGLKKLQTINEIRMRNCIDIIHAFLCPIRAVSTGIFSRSINGAHKKFIA